LEEFHLAFDNTCQAAHTPLLSTEPVYHRVLVREGRSRNGYHTCSSDIEMTLDCPHRALDDVLLHPVGVHYEFQKMGRVVASQADDHEVDAVDSIKFWRDDRCGSSLAGSYDNHIARS
jgi:hypothetical protein